MSRLTPPRKRARGGPRRPRTARDKFVTEDSEICREGCGSGQGLGNTPGEVHESAPKEAETDAMKRAPTTFGYLRFKVGLWGCPGTRRVAAIWKPAIRQPIIFSNMLLASAGAT